jgi:hypothetical protein
MLEYDLANASRWRLELKYLKTKRRLAAVIRISGIGLMASMVIMVLIILLLFKYPATFDSSYVPKDYLSPADAASGIANDIANKAVRKTNTFSGNTPDEYIGKDAVFNSEIADDTYSRVFPRAYADAYIKVYKDTYPDTNSHTITAITAGANACADSFLSPYKDTIPSHFKDGDAVITFKKAYIATNPYADPAEVEAAANAYNGEDQILPNENLITNTSMLVLELSFAGIYVFAIVGIIALIINKRSEYCEM